MTIVRSSLLRRIEANGGPRGLDVSGVDISGLDFSPGALSRLIQRRVGRSGMPSWAVADPAGRLCMNLEGAILRNITAVGVNLSHAHLQGCDFRGADLNGAHLSEITAKGVVFRGADLSDADLYLADLREARLGGATLRNAKLTAADLRDAYLLDADFVGARVFGARFGDLVLQEKRDDYLAYLQKWKYDNIQDKMKRRHLEARDIYRSLKVAYAAQGYADLAGEMHFREGKARKRSHWPPFTRVGDSGGLAPPLLHPLRHAFRMLGSFVRHLVGFLWDQVAESTCGFGERPQRPLYLSLAIVLAFGMYYWVCGEVLTPTGSVASVYDSLVYSAGAFSGLGVFDYSPAGPLTRLATSTEAVVGIWLFGLFLFTLGMKMARS